MNIERRGFNGFPDGLSYQDWKRKNDAIAEDEERNGIAEREARRRAEARFAALPSLDQIERRHGTAERNRIAALNLPQHRAVVAQAAE
ncbi:hypothetical protein [Aurantimonas endophytica]|uniref:Uncharacterized protein n=1 Tax=Aurantimonas endophytica TaxID=1522175 RepID=A0A7W6MQZ5_9HYPH|nr:hypothetical protein [Aurantimonas endophytica]MBB4004443.1 hypothetical protein [Aurantimonas endophytica]MCO6405280.1 hypothetical protein [Aurantimonas endophytica]